MFGKDSDLVSRISLENADRNIQRYYAGEISVTDLFAESTVSQSIEEVEDAISHPPVVRLTEDEFYTQLAQSPVSWTSIAIPQISELIFYPRWNFWNLLADPVLLNEIQIRFLTKFTDFLSDSFIYATSVPTHAFLEGIEFHLSRINSSILPAIPTELQGKLQVDPDCARLIIFDLNINLGRTISEAVTYIERLCPAPYAYITTFLNDLVPPTLRDYPWLRSKSNFHWLFQASDLLKYWDDQSTVDSILQVQKAFNGQQDWHNTQVQSAIKHLNQVAQSSS